MRVREEVDDGVRAGERGRQGGLVEDVSFDGTGPDALEQPPATRGPRDARDPVAGRQQLTHGTAPDDARGSGDHDVVHDRLTRHPAGS